MRLRKAVLKNPKPMPGDPSWQVVYRVQPGPDLVKVQGVLASHGILTRTVNNPTIDATHWRATAFTYRVRVAVPAAQARKAAKLLREFEARSEETVAAATRELHRTVLRALLIGVPLLGLIVLVFYLLTGEVSATHVAMAIMTGIGVNEIRKVVRARRR